MCSKCPDANVKQKKALDELSSTIENLTWGREYPEDEYIIFTGDSEDGPAMGYIEADGTINQDF